jgi:hypothetical protein
MDNRYQPPNGWAAQFECGSSRDRAVLASSDSVSLGDRSIHSNLAQTVKEVAFAHAGLQVCRWTLAVLNP